ncbi:AMIN-like domain-containing (lipo)protein [Archangium sp.]|uniref:AMIN-like domain-containing (lipo)protein n=1 Tax=Archangium sp. TaxID=1872627 RepID=UPI003BB99816
MKVIGRWMPTLGLAACLAAAGCKKEEPTAPTPPTAQTPDAGAGATPAPPPPPAPTSPGSQAAQPEDPKNPEWTAGLVNIQRSSQRPVTLREVRTARNEGFDRLVLQFDGDQVPGYHIEYIDKPVIKCGSGDPTEIAGQGWLQVRVQPAQAHEGAQVTVAERERKPGLPILQELELTCDFEGEVTWVLGVKHPNKYRVMELKEPTRLVVDVQH